MTYNELKRRFPAASESFWRRNADDQGPGPCASPEKQLLPNRAKRSPRMETELRQKFRLTVTLRYSDNRVRDPDAALSTILDCLVATRRQLEDSSTHTIRLDQG